jgi:tetrahydromethanopterin S-methyltransferase subunit A
MRGLREEIRWPTVPGDYDLGNAESPIAVVIIGRGILPLPKEHFAIKGQLVTENVGLEKVVANIVANPRIRFLLVCGKEELGHLPGEAILALSRNGVDKRKRIRNCGSAVPYLCNLSDEAIGRFREQVEVVNLVDASDMREMPTEEMARYTIEGKDRERIEGAILDCEARAPGPFPAAPCIESNEALQLEGRNAARMNYTSADVFTQKMLRLPSERLSTATKLVTVSEEFGIIVEPVDGQVMQVVSPEFAARLSAYLRGLD